MIQSEIVERGIPKNWLLMNYCSLRKTIILGGYVCVSSLEHDNPIPSCYLALRIGYFPLN